MERGWTLLLCLESLAMAHIFSVWHFDRPNRRRMLETIKSPVRRFLAVLDCVTTFRGSSGALYSVSKEWKWLSLEKRKREAKSGFPFAFFDI